ncbi:hypothetical protein GCM10010967_18240 [Dyadobacter beijingensis]|uniref:DUF5723 domain-containing protein n=1 Tax=Dyadobacter beijingensis TaxID=365489 RepID=A0ABQ2HQK7_9BACT|nr:DUF5723 family protein [Dyadobacter beijingensis]GGM86347.1 hypothetical protein GCM10010967_18240 [Dyadobacter beijingensis]
MRLTGIAVLAGILSLPARAQTPAAGPGVPGIVNGFRNPALLDTEGKPWALNIVQFGGRATSNTASIHIGDLGKKGADFLRSDILGTSSVSTGVGGLDIKGPSFAFRASDRLTVGITTRARIHANYGDVDGRLLSEIGEITKVEQSYPYRLPQIANMQTSIAAFTDIGATFSYELARTDHHRVRVGGTLKYVNGAAHTSIDVSELTGTIRLNSDRVSYITAATGTVSALTAGKLFNNFSLGNLLKPRKGSLGADIGVSYAFHTSAGEPWKFRLSASVTDIGNIRYRADSAYSKSYDIDIASDKRLYFNGSFNNSLFSRASRVFDSYPQYFKRTGRRNDIYTVALPAMLHVQADYRFSPQWIVNAAAGMSLQGQHDLYKLYEVPYIALAPSWVRNNVVLSVPLAYQEYAGLTAGASVRYKGFAIGSNSILSAVFGGKQVDLHIGYVISSQK